MTRYTLLILCLLTVKLSFCQVGYPKKIVINKDTIIALTIEQVKAINITYLQLQEAREYNALYKKTIDSYSVLLPVYDNTVQDLKNIIAIQENTISNKDELISVITNSDKKKAGEIKRLEIQNKILRGGFVITLITIGILLIL